MDADRLKEILALHSKWRAGDKNAKRADLGGADLRGAYLGGADLRGADLRGAYLGGANLGDAVLGGADLRGADLRGAYLGGAKGILIAGPANGWLFHAVRWKDGPRFAASCRWFGIAEARAHWAQDKGRDGHNAIALATVEALLAMARAQGWEMPAETVAAE